MRLAALALLAACGSSGSTADDGPGPGPDGSVLPVDCRDHGRPVAFQADVVPIIGHCGSELCHGGLAGASWPYTSLVNVATTECDDHRMLVKPGDPMNSYLIQKLDNFDICMGDRMPKLGNPLTAGELQILIDWICGGAPNN
jgi:hypothetical protein